MISTSSRAMNGSILQTIVKVRLQSNLANEIMSPMQYIDNAVDKALSMSLSLNLLSLSCQCDPNHMHTLSMNLLCTIQCSRVNYHVQRGKKPIPIQLDNLHVEMREQRESMVVQAKERKFDNSGKNMSNNAVVAMWQSRRRLSPQF